jgi:hypothetical protein
MLLIFCPYVVYYLCSYRQVRQMAVITEHFVSVQQSGCIDASVGNAG